MPPTSLPRHKITHTECPWWTCAVCKGEWHQTHPVPSVYTLASIEADLPLIPICDHCVEQHDPALFDELLAERRLFAEAMAAARFDLDAEE